MPHQDVPVVRNDGRQRYEIDLDEGLAMAYFTERGSKIVFTHTEVPQELEGQGIGSRLIRSALDDARERGLKVVPLCPFVKAYIRRHDEYQDLL
ncbi:MAG: GNAT family N-acetyltransferase [Bacteroidota bacterium]